MEKRLTLEKIAEMTGTSKSTVSRVLTGKGYVAPEVRESIIKVMEEKGYRPRQSRKTKNVRDMVMVIASQLNSEVQVTLANSIRATLEKQGKKTAIVSVNFGSSELYGYIDYAREREFAGIILLGALDTDELREVMSCLTCPVVLLNQTIEGLNSSRVEMEDYESGYQATRYLLEKGHRRIAFLNGYVNAVAVADRERGFCDAMADAGILADDITIAYKDFTEESGSQFAEEMVAAGLPYSAVIAANDLLAIGLLLRLQILGISVPEQISIVGFDDTLATRVCHPAITTVGYDFAGMGEALAQLLLEHMEKPLMSARSVSFAAQLAERDSVKVLL